MFKTCGMHYPCLKWHVCSDFGWSLALQGCTNWSTVLLLLLLLLLCVVESVCCVLPWLWACFGEIGVNFTTFQGLWTLFGLSEVFQSEDACTICVLSILGEFQLFWGESGLFRTSGITWLIMLWPKNVMFTGGQSCGHRKIWQLSIT